MLYIFKHILASLLLLATARTTKSPVLNVLTNAIIETNSSLHQIESAWNIKRYPNFLQSCHMHKSGWELLKWKFTNRILSGLHKGPQNFSVCFMGSGVTAGYDSMQLDLFTKVVEDIMIPAFAKLNIKFYARNVGIASNPSMPYAMCSRSLCGADADIVLWEYTNDCGYPECEGIMEQFIRQTLLIPSHPIIALSYSYTPHW